MEKEKIGLMVDLETWGTQPNCMIRQIAILPFKWETLEALDPLVYYPSEAEQSFYGRVREDGTVKWWTNQNAELNSKLRGIQDSSEESCFSAAKSLSLYVKDMKKKYSVYFVARGATTFDYPILENFLNMFGAEKLGIAFYRVLDLRSLTSLLKVISGHEYVVKTDGMTHNAMFDCHEQLEQLRRVKASLLPL